MLKFLLALPALVTASCTWITKNVSSVEGVLLSSLPAGSSLVLCETACLADASCLGFGFGAGGCDLRGVGFIPQPTSSGPIAWHYLVERVFTPSYFTNFDGTTGLAKFHFGGYCTCPDGTKHQVTAQGPGITTSDCYTVGCEGGVPSKHCEPFDYGFVDRKVTCAGCQWTSNSDVAAGGTRDGPYPLQYARTLCTYLGSALCASLVCTGTSCFLSNSAVLTPSAGSVTLIPSSACYQLPSPYDASESACYSLAPTFPAKGFYGWHGSTKINGQAINATTVALGGNVTFTVLTNFPSILNQGGVQNQFYLGDLRQPSVDCYGFSTSTPRSFERTATITFPAPGCRVLGQKFDQQNSCGNNPSTTANMPLAVVWVPFTTQPPPVSAPTSSCGPVSLAPSSTPTNSQTSAPTAAPAANSAQVVGPLAGVLASWMLSF